METRLMTDLVTHGHAMTWPDYGFTEHDKSSVLISLPPVREPSILGVKRSCSGRTIRGGEKLLCLAVDRRRAGQDGTGRGRSWVGPRWLRRRARRAGCGGGRGGQAARQGVQCREGAVVPWNRLRMH